MHTFSAFISAWHLRKSLLPSIKHSCMASYTCSKGACQNFASTPSQRRKFPYLGAAQLVKWVIGVYVLHASTKPAFHMTFRKRMNRATFGAPWRGRELEPRGDSPKAPPRNFEKRSVCVCCQNVF